MVIESSLKEKIILSQELGFIDETAIIRELYDSTNNQAKRLIIKESEKDVF